MKNRINIENDIYNACEVLAHSKNIPLLASIVFLNIFFINFLLFLYTDIYLLCVLIILIDISFLAILSLSIYYMRRYNSGKLKFDKSIYDIPEMGEDVICVDKFYYDRLLCKVYKGSEYDSKSFSYIYKIIYKNETFKVVGIFDIKNSWEFHLRNNNDNSLIIVSYFQMCDILKSKSELRKFKLKKLKIGF